MNYTNLIDKLSPILAKEDLTSKSIFESLFGELNATTFLRVIIAIAIGVMIAVLFSFYNKGYLGGFMRKLIEAGATSPETAKTLYELGYDDKLGVRAAIKQNIIFSRFLACVEQNEADIEYQARKEAFDEAHKNDEKPPKFKGKISKADIDTAHFYIPEERISEATDKFSGKGANWMGLCLILVILAICLAVIMLFLPQILGFIQTISSI